MTDLTLYDLMSEDMTIWAKLLDNKHIQIQIENELGEIVYLERSHLAAWETMVYFAKQVLSVDERIQRELEEIG